MFKCSICKKIFDRKYNYDRHITSKNNCVYKEDNDDPDEEEQPRINLLECEHCKKTYSTKFNLNKHIKKCSILSKKNDVIEQKETLYKERISHLESQVLELTKKIGNTYSYQINQHLDQSVHQQNIQINAYGHENLNYITPNQIEKLISHPSTCLPEFIKMVHYHEEHPENHNVVNIKENIIKTLKCKNNWKMLDFECFVEKFAIEKYDQLCDLYNSDEINIDDVIREKFEGWADQFDYTESNTRKKAEEDAKLAIILGSQWLSDKKITKRGLRRILDGEMMLPEEDMEEIERIKKMVGWGISSKSKIKN
jgi:hypothetical protein